MIKKLIILIILALAIGFIADYYGIVEIPIYQDKPKILKTRDDFLYKTKQEVDSELK